MGKLNTALVPGLVMAIAMSLLAACGGGNDPPPASKSTPVAAGAPDERKEEPPLSALKLSLEEDSTALRSVTSPVRLKASGGTLSTNKEEYTVYLNGDLLNSSQFAIAGNVLSLTSLLKEGKNDIDVFAPDASGALIETQIIAWAGDGVVTGRVLNESRAPVSGVKVVASLGDDSSILATAVTDVAGTYTINNFPKRTVLVNVTSPDGLPGSTSGVGGGAFSDVVLLSFRAPVNTPNNDFAGGVAGWTSADGAVVTLVDHIENPGPTASGTQALSRFMRWVPFTTALAQPAPTKDLAVQTNGLGPKTVTYTFTPAADAKTAKIKYRFQTSEFPTYLGTRFNDSFKVTLRAKGGSSVNAGGAMNELGGSAFSTTGSTAWRELTLDLPVPGDPIQVDVTVANVGDSALQSQVVLDFVSTSKVSISQAALFDIDNSPLRYLSAAAHSYFGGNTRVYATFKVDGPAAASLTKIELQVQQGGVVKARGALVSTLASSIYRPFTFAGVQLNDKQLVFEIPSSELARIATISNGFLFLKLVATSNAGDTAEKSLGSVALLDQWRGTKRYTQRDLDEGGDDWLTPAAREVFKLIDTTWGDFSNMNGGFFIKHKSHKDGIDADGRFEGYNARNAATAAKIIELLNSSGAGNKIKVVYVTHARVKGDPFYDAIKDVKLNDGRPAVRVIKHADDHDTHFHMNAQTP